MYPGTTAVRVFVGAGKPLPAWDGPVLGPIPPGVLIHVSFKTFDIPAVERWLMAMPPDHAPIILTYAHEPEQGTAAGDPTVEQFRTRWAELVAALADHPRRQDVLLVPVYTRYWWQAHPGDLRWLVPMVDAIGWDIYNNGTSYRTPDDLLSIPRDIAQRTGLPYLIAELGAVDIGPGRDAWMRAMVDAARADGALTVCWFHKDEWDLAAAQAATAQQTWRELTQEANVEPYLAPSLAVLRAEINARWPGRDHTSDGWIGDARHQATKSDHNPNSRGSVDAADFDEDGVDFDEVFTAIKRHPSARYVIYERKLYHRLRGWKPEPYDGVNPHDKHFHVSIDQTREAEQNTQPWGLLEDDDMQLTDTVRVINDDKVKHSSDTLTVEGVLAQTNYYAILTRNLVIAHRAETATMRAAIDGLTAALAKVTTGGQIDTAGILAGIDQRLAAVRADMRDAVADLGEGGAEQVRGPQG